MDINSFALGYSAGRKKGGSGGGVELNIHYSLDTPPEDTSKLWVKTDEPNGVAVSKNFETKVLDSSSFSMVRNSNHTISHSAGVSGSVNGKIYIMGGAKNAGSSNIRDMTTEIVCYDPETHTFEALTENLSTTTSLASSATVGSKIYGFGGKTGTLSSSAKKTILCFDVETKVATTLSATLPVATEKPGVAPSGKNILIFGANGTSGTAKIYSLNTETNEIEKLSLTLPYSCKYCHACSDGKTVYIIWDVNNNLLKIDVENEKIDLIPMVSTGSINNHMVFVNDVIVYTTINTTYVIDTKTWTRTTISNPKNSSGTTLYFHQSNVVPCGDYVYYFDGYTVNVTQDNNMIQGVYRLEPCTTVRLLDEGMVQINPSLEKNMFSIIKSETVNAEIGVAEVLKGDSEGYAHEVEARLYKDGTWKII